MAVVVTTGGGDNLPPLPTALLDNDAVGDVDPLDGATVVAAAAADAALAAAAVTGIDLRADGGDLITYVMTILSNNFLKRKFSFFLPNAPHMQCAREEATSLRICFSIRLKNPASEREKYAKALWHAILRRSLAVCYRRVCVVRG